VRKGRFELLQASVGNLRPAQVDHLHVLQAHERGQMRIGRGAVGKIEQFDAILRIEVLNPFGEPVPPR
jgi:hypothetical protein